APGDLLFENGRITIAGTDRSVDLLELERQLRASSGIPEGVPRTLTTRTRYDGKAVNFPNGCHICEVEIERDTGKVIIARYAVVDDFGRIVNPLIAAGQVVGGTVQGIGQALLEHVRYDSESGQLLSG